MRYKAKLFSRLLGIDSGQHSLTRKKNCCDDIVLVWQFEVEQLQFVLPDLLGMFLEIFVFVYKRFSTYVYIVIYSYIILFIHLQ